jgi:zinc transporter
MYSSEHLSQQWIYILDAMGGGELLPFEKIDSLLPDGKIPWIHLSYTDEKAQAWLARESGIDPVVLESLLAEDTRPRSFDHGQGLLVILRGVNLNIGAEPEDMVSVRLWIEPSRIITISHRKLMALEDLTSSLEKGEGPVGGADFVLMLAQSLVRRMSAVLGDLEDGVAILEDDILAQESHTLRGSISLLRRKAIRFRRYMAPQREALERLHAVKGPWFDEIQKVRIREIADQMTRYVEDLDAIKDRAAILQDELEARIGNQMNKTMYLLSIVAAIFLPLGLLTGLLGINVGGIPGTESPYAFFIVCGILFVIAAMQILIFRRMRWM